MKPLSEFTRSARRKNGVGSLCKVCRRLYDHERYVRLHGTTKEYVPLRSERGRSAWLRSLKDGKPCVDCGEVYPHQVMQWDHKPGFEKLGDVSQDFWGRTRDEVLAEIAKCDLVCTNCHAIRTFARNGWAQRWLNEHAADYVVRRLAA